MPKDKSSKIDFPAHEMIKRAQGRLRNAWQDYYNLFRLIEEKVYKIPPIVDFRDCKREEREDLKNYLPPDMTYFFNSQHKKGIPQKIDIPACLKGKVGFVNSENNDYFLDSKRQLTKEESLEMNRLGWIQWTEHIDMAYSAVLDELESSLTELECTLNKTNRVLNAKLRDKYVYRFWSNPDMEGRPLLESLIKLESIENIEPYNKVENYKSCKSLLYSYTYTNEESGNKVFKNTPFDPEGYYNKVLHLIKEDIFQEPKKLVSPESEREVKQQVAHLSIPLDTKWPDIEMGVDYHNEKLCIKVKGKNTKIGFLEFGLKDGRARKGNSGMTDLLKRFLEYAGAENNVIYTGKMQKEEFTKLDTDTKRLNKLIRLRIKGIDDPPITYTKSEGFKSNFGKLYLIAIDYDHSREINTSELYDVTDSSLDDSESLD